MYHWFQGWHVHNTGEGLISRCEYDTLLPASVLLWSCCPWALHSQIPMADSQTQQC